MSLCGLPPVPTTKFQQHMVKMVIIFAFDHAWKVDIDLFSTRIRLQLRTQPVNTIFGKAVIEFCDELIGPLCQSSTLSVTKFFALSTTTYGLLPGNRFILRFGQVRPMNGEVDIFGESINDFPALTERCTTFKGNGIISQELFVIQQTQDLGHP